MHTHVHCIKEVPCGYKPKSLWLRQALLETASHRVRGNADMSTLYVRKTQSHRKARIF